MVQLPKIRQMLRPCTLKDSDRACTACQAGYTLKSPLVNDHFDATTKDNGKKHSKQLGEYIDTERDLVVLSGLDFIFLLFLPHGECFIQHSIP